MGPLRVRDERAQQAMRSPRRITTNHGRAQPAGTRVFSNKFWPSNAPRAGVNDGWPAAKRLAEPLVRATMR